MLIEIGSSRVGMTGGRPASYIHAIKANNPFAIL